MTESGRLLLECVIGMLVLCAVLGLLPGDVATSAKLRVIERTDAAEARCLREGASGIMAYGARGRLSKGCREIVELRCGEAGSRRSCSLALRAHPAVPAAEVLVPGEGGEL